MVMFHAFKQRDAAMEAQIAFAVRSIAAHYPEAEIVLLTNPLGEGARLPPGLSVRAQPIDLSQIMFERVRAYREHARSVRPGTVVVFMDTDMLFVRRVDEILVPGADLSVTVRQIQEMPINGGLIVADTARHEPVCRFFDRMLERYADLSDAEKRWDGDQIVLQRLLRAPVARLNGIEIVERDGLVVRFAPVSVFNNTPRSWYLRLGLFRPGARLLHFKGWRKRRMPAYARRFLSPGYLAYARWLSAPRKD
jgi:hypothetical protein